MTTSAIPLISSTVSANESKLPCGISTTRSDNTSSRVFNQCVNSTDWDEVLRLLRSTPEVDPSAADYNYAIQCASWHGQTEVACLLLQDKRVDPSAANNYAIRWACRNGHVEVVRLLLQSARVTRLALQSALDWKPYLALDEMGLLCHTKKKPCSTSATATTTDKLDKTTQALASQGERFCSTVASVLREQGDIPEDLTRCLLVPCLTGFPYP